MTTAYVHSPAEIQAAAGDPLLSRLTAWLRSLPEDALRDVRDEPADRWTLVAMLTADGRRCLVGIACGSYDAGGYRKVRRPAITPGPGIDFDRLAERHGLSVVVPLLQQAAAQILRERQWETAGSIVEASR